MQQGQLWRDLETDAQRVEFLKIGRASETGIIAKAIEVEVSMAFKARLALFDAIELARVGLIPSQERIDDWCRLLDRGRPNHKEVNHGSI